MAALHFWKSANQHSHTPESLCPWLNANLVMITSVSESCGHWTTCFPKLYIKLVVSIFKEIMSNKYGASSLPTAMLPEICCCFLFLKQIYNLNSDLVLLQNTWFKFLSHLRNQTPNLHPSRRLWPDFGFPLMSSETCHSMLTFRKAGHRHHLVTSSWNPKRATFLLNVMIKWSSSGFMMMVFYEGVFHLHRPWLVFTLDFLVLRTVHFLTVDLILSTG